MNPERRIGMLVWEIVGWIGTALYVLAYVLLALRMLSADRVYYGLNVVAALFVAAVSVAKGSAQAAAINGLWAAASVYGVCGLTPPHPWLRPFIVRIAVAIQVGGGLFALRWVGLGVAASWMAWGSVATYTGAYVLFVGRRVAPLEFHIVNFIASTAILPVLILEANWPVVALEVAWAVAAMIGIGSDIAASERRGV